MRRNGLPDCRINKDLQFFFTLKVVHGFFCESFIHITGVAHDFGDAIWQFVEDVEQGFVSRAVVVKVNEDGVGGAGVEFLDQAWRVFAHGISHRGHACGGIIPMCDRVADRATVFSGDLQHAAEEFRREEG